MSFFRSDLQRPLLADEPKEWTLEEVYDEYKELAKKLEVVNTDLHNIAKPCGTFDRDTIEQNAKILKATLDKIKGHKAEFKSVFVHSSRTHLDFPGIQEYMVDLKKRVVNASASLSQYAKEVCNSAPRYAVKMQTICGGLNATIQQAFPFPQPQTTLRAPNKTR